MSATRRPPPDLLDSPLYLLAVLCAARRSRDRALERVTRRRLDRLGIRVAFGDELPAPSAAIREEAADAAETR